MNNEVILNKLVELGYPVTVSEKVTIEDGETHNCNFAALKKCFDAAIPENFVNVQSALIAECAKKHLEIVIEYEHVHIISPETRETIFGDKYSRQAIIEAFCKVTGVECDT